MGAPNGGKGFILVIEDDPETCAALVGSLASEGYSSSAVRTLDAARRITAKVAPDVVVLDLGLPDGDGQSFLHHLRGSGEPRLSDIPVCVVSGKANARELAAGADLVFAKPVRLEELVSAIEDLKSRRAAAGHRRAGG